MPTNERIPFHDLDSILAKSGNKGRTNSSGQILLPKNGLNLEVLAQGLGLYGREFRFQKNKFETMLLKAGMDQTVRVFVTHADGLPAVDVVVKHVQIFGEEMSNSQQSARTNAQGLAQLVHIQVSLQRADPTLMQAILVGVPTGESMEKIFNHVNGPPKEVHFQLPAIGFVKVAMMRADSTVFPNGTEVSLQKKGGISSQNDALLGLDKRKTVDGRALFPVGLHLDLVASTFLQEHRSTITASGDGPTLPGQTVILNFQQEEDPCFLTGRILHKDGTPLISAKISGGLYMRSMGQSFRVKTGEDGHFKLPIRNRHFSTEDLYDEGTPFRIARFAHKPRTGEMWTGQLKLEYNLLPGVNGIGDIILGAELLSAGIVVDQFGNPVPDAYLNIQGLSTELTTSRGNPMKVAVGDSNFNSNAEGEFSLRGDDSISLLYFHALKEGYVPEKFTLDAGMSHQELVLQKGGSWEIRLLIDPEIPPSTFRGNLEIDFGNGSSQTRSISFQDQDGVLTARIDSPIPGVYTLKLVSSILNEEMLLISDIEFGPGIPLDRRLDPIDFRGKIFKRTLHLIAPDGTVPATYMFAPPSRRRGIQLPNDTALYTTHESWETFVWQDSKMQKVLVQQPQTEVRLEPAYPMQVTLDPFPTLKPGSQLWLNLTQNENSIHSEHSLEAGSPLRINLRTGGAYDFQFNERYKEVDATGNQFLHYGPEEQLTLHIEVQSSEELMELQMDGSLLHPPKQD